MGDREAAQAAELVRALRDQMGEMTKQLTWLDRRRATGNSSRALRMRSEAAALRRDIDQAQIHIHRLQHRYFAGKERAAIDAIAQRRSRRTDSGFTHRHRAGI